MKHATILKQAVALSLLPATLLLTQGGCQSSDAPNSPQGTAGSAQCKITGCTWLLDLSSLSGVAANVKKPRRSVTLVFEQDGKVHGCAGVNQYFGPVEILEGDKLKFGSLGCTMMSGPGLEYEKAFLDVLASVDSYELAEGKLLLKSGEQIVAKLTPEQQ